MRAQFILSEVGQGLRRNLTMTVAVVVTVAISLALFGAGLLIRAQVDTMKDYWYDKVEVAVFLCGEAVSQPSCAGGPVTEAQREQIGADLRALPQVKKVYYESKQEAYRHFREQFKDSDVFDSVRPESMPESYRVKLTDPEQFEIVASAFVGRPGVQDVQDQRQVLDRFFQVLNGIQVAALSVALVQIIAATLLISNTIRVSAFTRRRETGIMRLVGASNWSIQLPFILEGAISGLVGALLASGALAAVEKFVVRDRLVPNFPFTNFVGWGEVWAIIPVLLVTGVLLAGLSSFLTLRRYLRV
jgi:cell division transport system permease protein